MNPMYLMFPVAVSTSMAFMLPVATPPNAVAYSYGRLTVLDMVRNPLAIHDNRKHKKECSRRATAIRYICLTMFLAGQSWIRS